MIASKVPSLTELDFQKAVTRYEHPIKKIKMQKPRQLIGARASAVEKRRRLSNGCRGFLGGRMSCFQLVENWGFKCVPSLPCK